MGQFAVYLIDKKIGSYGYRKQTKFIVALDMDTSFAFKEIFIITSVNYNIYIYLSTPINVNFLSDFELLPEFWSDGPKNVLA